MVGKDDKKAKQRFVDQPGQWKNITPKAVKERQKGDWDKFFAGQAAKKNGTKKK